LVNKRVGKIFITNRTRNHAEELRSAAQRDLEIATEVIDFKTFVDRLDEVDVVISSTGSAEPILYKYHFAERERKVVLIDIAVPRDIDTGVTDNPNVILRNIDDLHSIIDGNQGKRLSDLPKVKKLIMTEMVDFLTWYYSLPLMPQYEKTKEPPSVEQTREILNIKAFLGRNVSEIHKLAARSTGNFRDDLDSHMALIHKLRSMHAESIS
ncbi:MAG: hypothetical protein ABIV48_11495, partial [Pyrinomonadaceae bacterium]